MSLSAEPAAEPAEDDGQGQPERHFPGQQERRLRDLVKRAREGLGHPSERAPELEQRSYVSPVIFEAAFASMLPRFALRDEQLLRKSMA